MISCYDLLNLFREMVAIKFYESLGGELFDSDFGNFYIVIFENEKMKKLVLGE